MDWRTLAELELGETPTVVDYCLKELQVLLEQAEITYPQGDNNRFLLRFLRVDKFDVSAAFQRIIKYYKLRAKMIPRGCGPCDFKNIYNGQMLTVLPGLDSDHRKVLIARVGHWNASSGFTLEDAYVPDILLLEHILDDDETQVRGLVFIVDMGEFSFWHIRQFGFGHHLK
ncbi:alpha-tocopherol transfer protein-like, partial [Tropilaelaps mercedesae]